MHCIKPETKQPLFLQVFLLFTFFLCTSCPNPSLPPPVEAEFMLHDNEGPNASGQWAAELGINTISVYLDTWEDQEPADDTFVWDSAIPNNTADYSHCIARIGLLHVLAWSPDKIPDWTNPADIDGIFKTEFGEYVEAAVGELLSRNIDPDLYLVELEANYAGHELPVSIGNRTNAWIIDWIKWEADLIKSIDSNAKICTLLTPTEFRPEESLDNTGDLGKILMNDFIDRMISADVPFDSYGFNVASGIYDDIDDWTVLQTVLDSLMAEFDKTAYIWGMGYPAGNTGNPVFHHPRAGGYSETWQTDQYVQSLQYLLNKPGVLGVGIDLFDYQEGIWTAPVLWGLVAGDRENPASLEKRPSFDAVKDFWHENRR